MMVATGEGNPAPASATEGAAGVDAPIADSQETMEPGDLLPEPVWSVGLPASLIGPIEWRPLAGLKPYVPRFIEIPSFRGTPSWAMLRQLLRESGVRDPLLTLPDGGVVDGVHRLELARLLGLPEVPVRVIDLPARASDHDYLQLETMRAVLDVGRRRIAAPDLRRLLVELTQAEVRFGIVNQRTANLRRGTLAGSGPVGHTQRERGQAVGMSERAVRQLDRVLRDGPPDLVDAVRAGRVSLKQADRQLAERRARPGPTGTVRARDTWSGRARGEYAETSMAGGRSSRDDRVLEPRTHAGPPAAPAVEVYASPARDASGPTPVADRDEPAAGPPNSSTPSPSPISPAVEAFIATCRAFEAATRDFLQETAHWTGERREQRTLTIWQGLRQLEEQLDWMESAAEPERVET
jgi:hypothetical protein